MFISNAYAQAASGAAGSGDASAMLFQFLPLIAVFGVFYFLLIRPQQQQRKRLMEQIAAVKKGDIVVTSGGLIVKVRSIADDELRIELSPNVEARLARAAIAEVRSKTEPAPANDSKASAE